jgi:restriction endonuclease S subunit
MRRESRTEIGQECLILQIRNVGNNGRMVLENPSTAKLAELPKDQLLTAGEVLMVAKGSKPRAAVFSRNDRPTVATSQFFILRPQRQITADYLSFFLNQPNTLRELGIKSSGSGIPFLPKEALSRLKIPIPPIEVQKKIVAIYELGIKEQQLWKLLSEKRRQLLELSLQHILQV